MIKTYSKERMYIVISIVFSYLIFIKWKKSKLDYTPLDNIYNSGHMRPMILELLLCLIMNYPSLYGSTY